jgi:hypothetical protein
MVSEYLGTYRKKKINGIIGILKNLVKLIHESKIENRVIQV